LKFTKITKVIAGDTQPERFLKSPEVKLLI